jgi:hypothetical protein
MLADFSQRNLGLDRLTVVPIFRAPGPFMPFLLIRAPGRPRSFGPARRSYRVATRRRFFSLQNMRSMTFRPFRLGSGVGIVGIVRQQALRLCDGCRGGDDVSEVCGRQRESDRLPRLSAKA